MIMWIRTLQLQMKMPITGLPWINSVACIGMLAILAMSIRAFSLEPRLTTVFYLIL